MKIGLYDCDNKKPNLALMKLSAWHKVQGHETILNPTIICDHSYASCVFPENAAFAYNLRDSIGAEIGGSGVDMHARLDEEIEHSCPDYDLYNIDYSLGFTSRGCSRKCSFCIVPHKEGGIVEHSPLSEFVRTRKVVLQDNNFLASPRWKEKLEEMIDRKLSVDFNQGLDIRLLTEESADLLTKLNPSYLRFAWDNPSLEPAVMRGVNLLRQAGYPISRNKISFYILTNYNTSFGEDMHRVQTLHSLNIATFVQVYGKGSRRHREFQHWANMPGCWRSFTWMQWWSEIRKKDDSQSTIGDFLEGVL